MSRVRLHGPDLGIQRGDIGSTAVSSHIRSHRQAVVNACAPHAVRLERAGRANSSRRVDLRLLVLQGKTHSDHTVWQRTPISLLFLPSPPLLPLPLPTLQNGARYILYHSAYLASSPSVTCSASQLRTRQHTITARTSTSAIPEELVDDLGQVPVIDIGVLLKLLRTDEGGFDQGRLTPEESFCLKTIGESCAKWGFFHVVGHGVSEDLIQAFLDNSTSFFGLPKEEKYRIKRTATNSRGYFDDELTKQKQDWKEAIDIGAQSRNLNPCHSHNPREQLVQVPGCQL
eukprot:2684651-Pyramimonas_sp.AAC.1